MTWNGEEGQHMLPQEEHEDSLDGQETEEEDDHTSKRRKLSENRQYEQILRALHHEVQPLQSLMDSAKGSCGSAAVAFLIAPQNSTAGKRMEHFTDVIDQVKSSCTFFKIGVTQFPFQRFHGRKRFGGPEDPSLAESCYANLGYKFMIVLDAAKDKDGPGAFEAGLILHYGQPNRKQYVAPEGCQNQKPGGEGMRKCRPYWLYVVGGGQHCSLELLKLDLKIASGTSAVYA